MLPRADPAAILVAGLLVAASFGCAGAVDLPPVPQLPPPGVETEEFSGFYLRGDVGAGQAEKPDLSAARNPVPLAVWQGLLSPYASQAFDNTTPSAFGLIDAGFGYEFNRWLRFDATLEYQGGAELKSRFATADFQNPLVGGPLYVAGFFRAPVASAVALVNGYVNLPAFWGFSPFIGAGIGFADNGLSGVAEHGYAAAPSGFFAPTGEYVSSAWKTGFAWALTAGVDFSVAPNLKLEASYRYLNKGGIATGEAHGLADAAGGALVAAGCHGALFRSANAQASSDFRLGLIFFLGEPPAARGNP